MSGPLPIGITAIRDYCELTGTELLREEIDALLAMDAAYRQKAADEQPKD